MILRTVLLLVVLMGVEGFNGCKQTDRASKVASSPPPKSEPEPDSIKQAAVSAADHIEVGEERWDNGNLKIREEMKLDEEGEWILHGKTQTFWENGAKKLEMNYVNGIPHGPKLAWFPDGRPHSSGEYVDGKEHGTWIGYYADGKKQAEWQMNHGAFDGLETRWYPTGLKSMQGKWVKGRQVGYFTFWDEDGNVVRETDYGQPDK